MLSNVRRTARNRRKVSLPRSAEKEVEFLNVASGKCIEFRINYQSRHENIHYRRDKVFCHECRFCCTLSVCTNKDGTYFRESSDKNLTGSGNKALGAVVGYTLDMELYKKPDFRLEWST